MRRGFSVILLGVLIVVTAGATCWSESTSTDEAVLQVLGKIQDTAGNSVGDAEVHPYLNGKPYVVHGKRGEEHCLSGHGGLFQLELRAPAETIKSGNWAVKIAKSSFKPSKLIPITKLMDAGKNAEGLQQFSFTTQVVINRVQGPAFWVALIILIGIYVLISLELLHRTLAVLL